MVGFPARGVVPPVLCTVGKLVASEAGLVEAMQFTSRTNRETATMLELDRGNYLVCVRASDPSLSLAVYRGACQSTRPPCSQDRTLRSNSTKNGKITQEESSHSIFCSTCPWVCRFRASHRPNYETSFHFFATWSHVTDSLRQLEA